MYWSYTDREHLKCDWEDEDFEDFKGIKHTIRKFKTEAELGAALLGSEIQNVFFDIDLNYFRLNNNIEPKDKFKYMKDTEIRDLIFADNVLIQWIFERLSGITITLEPGFTGGILKYISMIKKTDL